MNRRLHVVHTENSCGWGGQEIRILTEASGMLARGHRVTLLCPPEARIHAAALERGIPVVGLSITRKRLGPWRALRAWLAEHRSDIDVLNTHSSTDSWLTALACATLRDAPPIVRTRHVSSPINQARSTRWLYRTASAHVVVTGEALRQQLHRDNGLPLEHMTSIPTGIALDYYRPLDQAEVRARLGVADRPTLGILGTLRNWKGHAYLLEAMASLHPRYPAWQLLVIGDGPQRQNLERKVQALGLSAHVQLVGNQNNVPDWLNACDLFTLPSYGDEGVPQSIMQAMACGLAVVSTPVGAIAEAVVDGETGLLVAPQDSVALAAGLERFMADPELRRQWGAAGLARAQARFGVDIMLDKMEAVFQRHARPLAGRA